MRTLISLLVLSLALIVSPGSQAAPGRATAGAAGPTAVHRVQARGKKKLRPKPRKPKAAVKKTEKTKKNDPGFAL
jgi:hypothetical protein